MHHFKTPLEAFLHWEKNTPETIFLKQPIKRKVNTYTYKAAGEEIRKIASGLIALDLPKKSHIALLSKNCAHWIMADLAIMMSGHISIPIYPTLNEKSINQILIHSDSKAIIIGKLDDFKSQKSGIPKIHKISIGLYGEDEGESWEELLTNSKPLKKVHKQHKEDLITIIYTSGTTGNPKGVMHSVGNFIESGNTLNGLIPMKDNPKFFSYLPLAHIAERIGIGTCAVLLGGTISFAESLETFAEDLEKTQPHIFFAVPRIWTKFQEKILASISQKRLNIILAIPLLNTVFKNKIRHKLGLSDAEIICSAAAPISISSVKWFEKIGIIIEQGYGMTEDCVISHFNLPGNSKIGTVGKPLPNVLVKLSPEGEICIKNKCLMKGYYKAPEITAAVFDKYGFLKTGDIGEYDHDGFLTITGRVKDQFKTDKGKYISPAPIELQLSKNTDIEQICIVGTGIPQPIALITLSSLGKDKKKEELSKGLIETIDHINPTLEKHEKIEKIVIMKE
ncbi:MAG: AMP-binding protein, partial [Flavobacteriaceae bacterium]|nr:AMP-binding protein [Flavobacteriaceae bacterium]